MFTRTRGSVVALMSVMAMVIFAGCVMPPPQGRTVPDNESGRAACLRLNAKLGACPESDFTGAIPEQDCSEFSDTGHCEAFSASVSCYDLIDICAFLGGSGNPGDLDQEEQAALQADLIAFQLCASKAFEGGFESEACGPLNAPPNGFFGAP